MSDDKPTLAERGSARRSALPRDAMPDDAPPPSDARYTEHAEIARGGMGRVVEATDTILGRTVAVKQVLGDDPELRRRFARETRITARLEHPSIVPVYDAGASPDGTPYYVMRKVSGRPLDRLVRDAATLADRLALVPHILAAAQAVAHAHERGVVHRDIKPTNILIGAHGETVVIDWGLAKVLDDDDDAEGPAAEVLPSDSLHTRVGVVFGTPGFMAPEQLRGDPVDERGDVYALGATLYHLLSQHIPHERPSSTEMMGVALAGPPKPLAALVRGVPPELSTIVETALARDPAQRYRNAGALADDLQRFLTGQLVASHRYSARERFVRFVRKHRVSLAIATLAVVAIVVGGTLAIRRIVSERDRADEQARLATKNQRDSEAARGREAERADQLLLVQARTLVDSNPTAAVALLKQLRSPPERWTRLWRNARGIAAGARTAGVARSLPGPQYASRVQLAPDGVTALVTGRDNDVWSYDLVHETVRQLARVPTGYEHVEFLDAQRLVAWHSGGYEASFVLLTRDTGEQLSTVALPTKVHALTTCAGRVAWIGDNGKLYRTTLGATPATEAVPLDAPVRYLSAAFRAPLVAVAGEDAIFTVDVTTLEVRRLARRGATWISWSSDDERLGVTGGDEFGIATLETGEIQWLKSNGFPLMTAMTGTKLVAIDHANVLSISLGDHLEPRFTDPLELSLGLQTSINNTVVAGSGRHLVLVQGLNIVTIPMPIEGIQRLAAHPSSSFIVGARAGRVFIWNLAQIFPSSLRYQRVENFARASAKSAFVLNEGRWYWLDVEQRTSKAVPEFAPDASVHYTPDPDVVIGLGHGDLGRAYVVRRSTGTSELLASNAEIAEMLPDGRFIVAYAGGRVTILDLATHREETVVERPGRVATLAWSKRATLVLYDDGFAWRRVEGRAPEHVQIPIARGQLVGQIADDGTAILPSKERLLRWMPDGSLVEVLRLASDIATVAYNRDLVVASSTDNAGWVLDNAGRVAGRIPAGATNLRFAYTENLAVFVDATGTIQVVDLVAGERWALQPADRWLRVSQAAISMDGTLVGGIDERGLAFSPIRIPATADATAAWLDELTSATADLGETALAWPPHATTANR